MPGGIGCWMRRRLRVATGSPWGEPAMAAPLTRSCGCGLTARRMKRGSTRLLALKVATVWPGADWIGSSGNRSGEHGVGFVVDGRPSPLFSLCLRCLCTKSQRHMLCGNARAVSMCRIQASRPTAASCLREGVCGQREQRGGDTACASCTMAPITTGGSFSTTRSRLMRPKPETRNPKT